MLFHCNLRIRYYQTNLRNHSSDDVASLLKNFNGFSMSREWSSDSWTGHSKPAMVWVPASAAFSPALSSHAIALSPLLPAPLVHVFPPSALHLKSSSLRGPVQLPPPFEPPSHSFTGLYFLGPLSGKPFLYSLSISCVPHSRPLQPCISRFSYSCTCLISFRRLDFEVKTCERVTY